MNASRILKFIFAMAAMGVATCNAEPVWANGNSLIEVISYDLQAHDSSQKLTDYQTNSVCLFLGYLRGFVESAAVASHYNSTALPFFLPETITNDQVERIVYKYLSDNPDKLNQSGGALIVAALTKEFPNSTFKPPNPESAPPFSAAERPADKLSRALMSGS